MYVCMFIHIYIYICTAFLFFKVAIDKNGKEISSKPGVYPPFGFSFPAIAIFLIDEVGVWHVMESHSTMLLWRHES